MKRLIDLNRGAIFEDTRGVVGSGPFKLGGQQRQGPANIDMNRRSIYHHTSLVPRSKPLHNGKLPFGQVKASSKNLLVGTNETAEDLTGQRAPVASSSWVSELHDKYKGHIGLRPASAPNMINRPLSLMQNQEPVFGHTKTYPSRTHQMQELYPFKAGVQSTLQDLDSYQSTYTFNHRPFNRHEYLNQPFWQREKMKRPWLQPPITEFKLQNRVPPGHDDQAHPNEAQLATLPHYTENGLPLETSEVRAQFRNPYQAREFYQSELSSISKPLAKHLQQTKLL